MSTKENCKKNEILDFDGIINILKAGSEEDQIKRQELLLQQIPEKDSDDYRQILNGTKLPDLYLDIIAKRIFDPDTHPDRVNFLIQQIMQDTSLEVQGIFSNEGYRQSEASKKVIFDIPFKLKSLIATNIEF